MAEISFEEAIRKLEQIVEELQIGELTLEDSLGQFKEGIELTSICNKKLDEVEKKISILIEESGDKIKEQPFILDREV